MKPNEHTSAPANKVGLKSEIRRLLAARDYLRIEEHYIKTPKVFTLCSGLLFDAEPLICMRAVEALGRLGALLARTDIEAVRVRLRKFFWSMNDESGSVGWYAAPAIGEIIVNVPELEPAFFPPLVALLNTEPFERAVHQAVARVMCRSEVELDWPVSHLTESLQRDDPYLVARALTALDCVQKLDEKIVERYLNGSSEKLEFYDFVAGDFYQTTLPDLARGIIEQRRKGDS